MIDLRDAQWYMYKIVAEDGTVLYSQRRWGNIEQARFRQKCSRMLFDIVLAEAMRKMKWLEG